MRLVIDFGNNGAQYGAIHREGCKRCDDPEFIGEFFAHEMNVKSEIMRAANELTGWNDDPYDPTGYYMEPCVILD